MVAAICQGGSNLLPPVDKLCCEDHSTCGIVQDREPRRFAARVDLEPQRWCLRSLDRALQDEGKRDTA